MKVGIDGKYSFLRVRNNNDLREYGAGILLSDIKKWGMDTGQIWLVSKPLSVFVTVGDAVTEYRFEPPFITDFASVPRCLRGIADNDDIRLIAPSLVHDYNFATHAMSFRNSNRLFRQMVRSVGGSWWLATKVWLAVASPIGRRCYNKYNIFCADYYKKTCSVMTTKRGNK